jgi:hypothetical protein
MKRYTLISLEGNLARLRAQPETLESDVSEMKLADSGCNRDALRRIEAFQKAGVNAIIHLLISDDGNIREVDAGYVIKFDPGDMCGSDCGCYESWEGTKRPGVKKQ